MILYVFSISIQMMPRHPVDGQEQDFGRQLVTQECRALTTQDLPSLQLLPKLRKGLICDLHYESHGM